MNIFYFLLVHMMSAVLCVRYVKKVELKIQRKAPADIYIFSVLFPYLTMPIVWYSFRKLLKVKEDEYIAL